MTPKYVEKEQVETYNSCWLTAQLRVRPGRVTQRAEKPGRAGRTASPRFVDSIYNRKLKMSAADLSIFALKQTRAGKTPSRATNVYIRS